MTTNNRGFSLLEVLLSLTILISIGLIFITLAQKNRAKENVNIAVSQINTINNAAIQYYSMYQQWPKTLAVLNPLLGKSATDPNCSVWKNNLGCAPYTISSTFNAHYFALSVIPPNATVASLLVTNLPNAYLDKTTHPGYTSVTAYTTTFSPYTTPQPPSGVLFAATDSMFGGSCNTSSPDIYVGRASPFRGCISGDSSDTQHYAPNTPYGLRLNTSPVNTITAGNNFGGSSNYEGAHFDPTTVQCPAGTQATMVYLPAGVMTVLKSNEKPSLANPTSLFLVESHFVTQGIFWKPCNRSTVGYNYNYTKVNDNANFWAGFGDVLCLAPAAVTRWPDGLATNSCYANQ